MLRRKSRTRRRLMPTQRLRLEISQQLQPLLFLLKLIQQFKALVCLLKLIMCRPHPRILEP